MKKVLAVLLVSGVAALALAGGGALAAKPAVQGCLGASVRWHATTEGAGGGFGHFVADTARDKAFGPGVGEEVQAVQAGEVPDADFENTCN